MGVRQNSKIMICHNIKLDKAYKNVLSFSQAQMVTLCEQNAVATAFNYSFIDYNKGEILANFTYSQCLNSNYLAFQNPYYDNKWFFAFIDDVIYSSEGATKIRYTIDVWSTFYENWNAKTCYVIREHVDDDTIGKHTIDEGLSVGEVVLDEDVIYDADLDTDLYVAITSNWSPDTKTGFTGIVAYSKGVFGSNVHLFPLNDSGIYNLEHYLFIVGGQGHASDIHDMFIVPQMLIPSGSYTQKLASDIIAGSEVTSSYLEMRYDSTNAYKSINKFYNIQKKLSFSDIQVKNNKCYCYPYNYLLVSNNIGSNQIYKYEDFDTLDTCDFELQLALAVGVSGRVVPLNYKSQGTEMQFENIDESITLAKYPTCSWSSDTYTNWLTQQAVNLSQKLFGSELTYAVGKIGEVGSGLLPDMVGSMLGGFSKQQLLPENTSGTNTGDVNFASKNQSPSFMRMRAKKEYMKQIDDYFTRFGYKVIENKVPNIRSREQFNYLQIGTGEHIGYGNIPSKYMDQINNICQNGVTIWHNHGNLGDYSVNNPIRS